MIGQYVRLYTDADGTSHFSDCEGKLSPVDFAPGLPPLFLSDPIKADQATFFGAPAGWQSDWHPSSGRHLFAVLSGEWEVTAADGESRKFAKGDVLLVEDTSGKGHQSRVIGDDDSLSILIRLLD